jgi:hypothetical protein
VFSFHVFTCHHVPPIGFPVKQFRTLHQLEQCKATSAVSPRVICILFSRPALNQPDSEGKNISPR